MKIGLAFLLRLLKILGNQKWKHKYFSNIKYPNILSSVLYFMCATHWKLKQPDISMSLKDYIKQYENIFMHLMSKKSHDYRSQFETASTHVIIKAKIIEQVTL